MTRPLPRPPCARAEHESRLGKKEVTGGRERKKSHLLILRLHYSSVRLLGHLRWVPVVHWSVEKRRRPPRALGQAPRVGGACFLRAEDSQTPAAWASSKSAGPTRSCRWRSGFPRREGRSWGGGRVADCLAFVRRAPGVRLTLRKWFPPGPLLPQTGPMGIIVLSARARLCGHPSTGQCPRGQPQPSPPRPKTRGSRSHLADEKTMVWRGGAISAEWGCLKAGVLGPTGADSAQTQRLRGAPWLRGVDVAPPRP